jgi:chemotaxis signal transduction protein
MEGVINLRGKIVSVIDLRKRLARSQPRALNRRNRILVVEHGRTPGGTDRGFRLRGTQDSRG